MSPTLAQTSSGELADAWRAYMDDRDDGTRNRLLEHYLPLVRQSAERLHTKLPSYVDIEDLVSFGTVGLFDAVQSFDPTRGVRFKTFCNPRVRGAILDGLRAMDWAPRLVRSRARKLDAALRTLKAALGRMPTEDETANHLSLPMKEFRKVRKDAFPVEVASLSDSLGEGSNGKAMCVEHVLSDGKAPDPQRQVMRDDLRRFLTSGLARTQRLVVMLYYYEGLSMAEIGRTMDLSESRVCQIHSAAISFLKQKFGGMSVSGVLSGQREEGRLDLNGQG